MPISFADGHVRTFPRLTTGPFRYKTPADVYLEVAQRYAHVPLKQAVISASALSLLYPQGRLPGYSREQYLAALIAEQAGEIRRCLQKGTHRDRVLEAAEYLPLDRLGTTDDCGFAPFSDDTSRTRETAFAKIRARVAGTALARKVLGLE